MTQTELSNNNDSNHSFNIPGGTTFPSRLHTMLTEIERTGYYHNIVSWCPHGWAFVVRDRALFVRHVLPW